MKTKVPSLNLYDLATAFIAFGMVVGMLVK